MTDTTIMEFVTPDGFKLPEEHRHMLDMDYGELHREFVARAVALSLILGMGVLEFLQVQAEEAAFAAAVSDTGGLELKDNDLPAEGDLV